MESAVQDSCVDYVVEGSGVIDIALHTFSENHIIGAQEDLSQIHRKLLLHSKESDARL